MGERAEPISVAIETTSRRGGVALGAGDRLVEALPFDAARRAATQVIVHLDDLLGRHGLAPAAIQELYLTAGPGSFTGTRIGVTVARTLARALPLVRCVAMPTPVVVAEAACGRAEIEHLAVVLDARQGRIYVTLFERADRRLRAAGPPAVTTVDALLASTPRPLHVTGEGLGYHAVEGRGVIALDESLWLPTVANTWTVGRRLAAAGRFTDPADLAPIYMGKPEAVRLWEQSR
ncbi:MAG: tRNA (adenosine(37)-N6)-threonylcarbamoyltransferase complex dimerization subunit type 1 TsaB [Planctomycetes bacterium]|nr:tRNA (adenosine(37)-N6)-threonylcarbamoyltransferase complex dimerization subunit type 1 TsaB [Planctomycetota bacterium]